MPSKHLLLVLLAFISFFLGACQEEPFPVQIHSFPQATWPQSETVQFDFKVRNPGQLTDMLYQVQYDRKYGYENIWLKYWLVGPNKDTLTISKDNLILFEPKTGKPIGVGPKQRLSLNAYFLKSVVLKDTGIYSVRIRHYMRRDSLKGVQSIGLKLREPS